MNDIAKNIRFFRNREQLTQEALGERLQVTRQTVSSWERGNSLPDVEMLTRISQALGVELLQLIYGEQYQNEYARGRLRRGRIAGILGAAILLVLLVVLGLRDAAQAAYYRFDLWPLRVFYPAQMACFFLAGAFAPALLSVWKDIRIRNSRFRQGLLLAGIFLLLFPTAGLLRLFGVAFPEVPYVWAVFLFSHPWLCFLPGVLVWLGLNR